MCQKKNQYFFSNEKIRQRTMIWHSHNSQLRCQAGHCPLSKGSQPLQEKKKTIHCGGLGSRGSGVGQSWWGEEKRGQGTKTTTSIRTAPRDLGEPTAGSFLWAPDPGPSLFWLIAGVSSLRQALFPPEDFSSRCCQESNLGAKCRPSSSGWSIPAFQI